MSNPSDSHTIGLETTNTTLPVPFPTVPEIVQRYAAGESIQVLAKESAVAPRTIYRWMLSELGNQEYYNLQTQVLIDRIADADTELDRSETMCHIARAREKMRFSRMDFERRRARLYGPKQESKQDMTLTVIVNRDRTLPKVIKSDSLISQQNSELAENVQDT